LLGHRIYIAVTAAFGCFLGVGLSETAKGGDLALAYGEFATEAKVTFPANPPTSVNLDGWSGTHQAWHQLFPGIIVMPCFLHVVLSIQERCRSKKSLYQALSDGLWHLYRSATPSEFGQRLRRLYEWVMADTTVPLPVKKKIESLKAKAETFKQTFLYPEASRTSNQVDRLMNYQDRILYSMQYFHGTTDSAIRALRAMALLWNFHPYGQKVRTQAPYFLSPFEDLNGFRYDDHWLKNLLIASSMNGRNTGKPVPRKTMEN
jgi:hypothetical protein